MKDRRDPNALLATLLGIVSFVGVCGFVAASGSLDRPGSPIRTDPVAEARSRAVAWATPACRDAVIRAVAKAADEDAVVKAAWDACPDHPDAYD